MKLVVIGGGAIGLLLAGRAHQAGLPVALLARPHTVATLARAPLTLRSPDGTQTVTGLPVAATVPDLPAAWQSPDLALLCVKGYHTAAALATLAEMQPRHVLTLQNGLGHEETLADSLGTARVLAGAITSSVQGESPQQMTVTKQGGIGLAALDPASDAALAEVAALLAGAGFAVQTYADYRALKWSKALLNMLGNATPAILDMPLPDVYADARLVRLERRALLEALAVMRARGIRPVNLPAYPAALLAWALRGLPEPLLFPLLRRRVAGGRGGKLPSLHADLNAGRAQSEGAYLYGAVAEAAQAAGLAAPVNATLWHTLHALATGELERTAMRSQPAALLARVRTAA